MSNEPSQVFAKWAEAYDLLERRTDWGRTEDIPFYAQQANSVNGKVLEIGCGTGRLYLELLEDGHDVYGIDNSQDQLNVLKSHGENRNLEPQVHCMDMRHFDLDEQFDLVIVPFNTFSHNTTRGDQFQCLEQIRRHLSPDGKAVLDMPLPRMSEGTYTREYSIDGSEFFLVEKYDLDIVRMVKKIDRRLFKDGKEFGSTSYEYARIFKNEFIHLIQRVGFKDWNLYGDFDCSSIESNSSSLIWEISP
jgi:SAM-dependent methyltransferase